MARMTSQVQKGMLTTFLPGGISQTVELNDEVWMCWLRESNECCFRFSTPLGTFSVRCEDSRYWHADCHYAGRNYKVYLGKTECVTIYALYNVAMKLYTSMHGEPVPDALLELIQSEEAVYRENATLARETSFLLASSQAPAVSESIVYDITLVQRLIPREQEVLLALSSGLTNLQIAAPLGISVSAVKMHLRHIYYKLSIASRNELLGSAGQLASAREHAIKK